MMAMYIYIWSFSGLIVLVLIHYFRIIIVNLLTSWEIVNSVNRIFILATCSHVFAFLLPSGKWERLKWNHNEISCHLRRKTRVKTPTSDNMTTKGTLAYVTTSKLSPGKRSQYVYMVNGKVWFDNVYFITCILRLQWV